MILDTITSINSLITATLGTTAAQVAGLVIPFHDQQERSISLRVSGASKRLGMDSKLLWQSAHLTDGSAITSTQTFGSFTDHIYDVRFVLIGLSKSTTGINIALAALDATSYVVVDGFDENTLSVLTRYFQVKAGQEKNYDPDLCAFAIRYHMEGVTDDDLETIPTLS